MNETKHISATVQEETVNAVNLIADKEKRSFSSMVDILLAEAVENRNSKKQTKK